MSRLLLVDDNPSIHRIAESLLAPTDVELICVDSAAEALDRIGRGERFDVALVDTAMPGMDGWTLLSRLRAMEETARMPIALMAGVLDPVDPAKLAKAPIQGFLKKPIELRELGDRVKALLVTPVPVGPSPFSTIPATPAQDLVKRAGAALPEYRHEPEEVLPAAAVAAVAEPATEVPTGLSEADLVLPGHDEDLLLLTAEDLWPEEPAPIKVDTLPSVPALADVHLELEELDLDSLQDLTGEPLPDVMPVDEPEPVTASAPATPVHVPPGEDEHLVTLPGLVEVETIPTDFDFPPSTPAAHEHEADSALEHLPAATSLLGLAGAASAAGLAIHEATHHEPLHQEPAYQEHLEAEAAQAVPEPVTLAFQEPVAPLPASVPVPEPVEVPAAGGQEAAVPGHPADTVEPPSVTGEQARAVVQALLADPVLVDALVKAVVARMGDQVLREIAWEVMPDLAGRLQR